MATQQKERTKGRNKGKERKNEGKMNERKLKT
jgi:hypothetical protein